LFQEFELSSLGGMSGEDRTGAGAVWVSEDAEYASRQGCGVIGEGLPFRWHKPIRGTGYNGDAL